MVPVSQTFFFLKVTPTKTTKEATASPDVSKEQVNSLRSLNCTIQKRFQVFSNSTLADLNAEVN